MGLVAELYSFLTSPGRTGTSVGPCRTGGASGSQCMQLGPRLQPALSRAGPRSRRPRLLRPCPKVSARRIPTSDIPGRFSCHWRKRRLSSRVKAALTGSPRSRCSRGLSFGFPSPPTQGPCHAGVARAGDIVTLGKALDLMLLTGLVQAACKRGGMDRLRSVEQWRVVEYFPAGQNIATSHSRIDSAEACTSPISQPEAGTCHLSNGVKARSRFISFRCASSRTRLSWSQLDSGAVALSASGYAVSCAVSCLSRRHVGRGASFSCSWRQRSRGDGKRRTGAEGKRHIRLTDPETAFVVGRGRAAARHLDRPRHRERRLHELPVTEGPGASRRVSEGERVLRVWPCAPRAHPLRCVGTDAGGSSRHTGFRALPTVPRRCCNTRRFRGLAPSCLARIRLSCTPRFPQSRAQGLLFTSPAAASRQEARNATNCHRSGRGIVRPTWNQARSQSAKWLPRANAGHSEWIVYGLSAREHGDQEQTGQASPACWRRVSSERPPASRISSWAIVSSRSTRAGASSSRPQAAWSSRSDATPPATVENAATIPETLWAASRRRGASRPRRAS